MCVIHPANDPRIKWSPANFQTHCWFLTLHAHHLAIMPAIQRYGKQLRAIKEINRMISELTKTRAQWENTPAAARNNEVFNRWKQQIKNLNRSKLSCDITLIDPQLLAQTLQFYSTVCEFILYQMEGRPAKGPFMQTVSPQLLKPTSAFSALPEWYVEDIADFLLFVIQ